MNDNLATDAKTRESPLRGLAFLMRRASSGDPSSESARRPRAFATHAAAVAAVSVLLVAVWALTTRAYFWPVHALVPLALSVAVHGALVLANRSGRWQRADGTSALVQHIVVSGAVWIYLLSLWAEGGTGYFWPGWALPGLAALAGVHALEVAGRRARLESAARHPIRETGGAR